MSVRETVVDALVRTLDTENRLLEVPHVPVYDVPTIWPEVLAGSAQREPDGCACAAVVEPIVLSAPAADAPKLDARATWSDADAHYRAHYGHKLSFKQECVWLDELRPFLSGRYLDQVHDEPLEPFVAAQKVKEIRHHANNAVLRIGCKSKTINLKLGLVRYILMQAARKWRLPDGKTWLQMPPAITMVEGGDERPPRPLTWQEQQDHLHKLPPHLVDMALFDLNVGAREAAICNLQWAWERDIKELDVLTFIVPVEFVKGRRGKKASRMIVCNSIAREIIERHRGEHPEYVFTYQRGKRSTRKPLTVLNNSGWQSWRERCGLGDIHVHDLRHTCGMRLREAGVPEETRSDVLWHRGKSMTTHYSAAQIQELHTALEKITTPANIVNKTLASLLAG